MDYKSPILFCLLNDPFQKSSQEVGLGLDQGWMSEGQTPSGCPVKIKPKEEELQEALGQMCVICA